MTMYYFHLTEDGERSADLDGIDFASFELAYRATQRAVQDMWWEMVSRGRDPRTCSFEITDAAATCLAVVPFVSALEAALQSPRISADAPCADGRSRTVTTDGVGGRMAHARH